MIKCFLYQMDEKNKRIITGLIENDEYLEYDPTYEYKMILEDNYTILENERKISNFGRLFYAVSINDEHHKYLNFNDYMLKVKLDMTENVAFASALSKEMLMSILENTNYFNQDLDLDYVDSGLTLMDDKGYKDYFDASVKGTYYGWTTDSDDDMIVAMKPEMELNFKVDAKLMDGLKLRLGYDYVKRKGEDVDPVSNLSVGATYALLKDISIFVDVNNLLNKQYYYE